MSDEHSKDRVYDSDYVADELRVPFVFIPRGAPRPLEWMAAHPGWVKFPATFVPRRVQSTTPAPTAAPQATAPGTDGATRPEAAVHASTASSRSMAPPPLPRGSPTLASGLAPGRRELLRPPNDRRTIDPVQAYRLANASDAIAAFRRMDALFPRAPGGRVDEAGQGGGPAIAHAPTASHKTTVTGIGGTTAPVGEATPALSAAALAGIAAPIVPLVAWAAALALLAKAVWPTPLDPDEDARLKEALKENDPHGLHGGLVPPPPTPTLPGLVPPIGAKTKPGEGGFIPPKPAPPVPGFTPAPPRHPVLPGRAIEVQKPTVFYKNRNKGLPPGAKTYSKRARVIAQTVSPGVTQILSKHEWDAHHLLSAAIMHDEAQLTADLLAAGFRMDSPSNIVAVARSYAAQQKLKAAGIHSPWHGHGHPDLIETTRVSIQKIMRELRRRNLKPGTVPYQRALKPMIDNLLKDLRAKVGKVDTLTENDDGASLADA
ncbi:AHH domain-containing protein [Acidisoma cladoniae]|uniref:AHH domain-containing protein n=1 Tax=Acidisoma cladoniae TaxID=3040935 RepID=UPI002549CB58|nr:AHH domain-containing protein [Acidisoma sp. PAMC 29798]